MKRILGALLILALLAGCVPAMATTDGSEYVGAWGKASPVDNGVFYEIFYIAADHKLFYVNNTFTVMRQQGGSVYVGSWKPGNGAGIHIKYGKNQEAIVTLLNQYMISLKYGIMEFTYTRIPDGYAGAAADRPDYIAEPYLPQGSLEDGVVILPGEYLAGQFIPDGSYIVRPEKKKEIEISVYHNGFLMPNRYTIGGKNNPETIAIFLEKNALFCVDGGNVTLTKFQGYGL